MIIDDIYSNAQKDFMKTALIVKDQFDLHACEIVLTRRQALDIIQLAQAIRFKEVAENGEL